MREGGRKREMGRGKEGRKTITVSILIMNYKVPYPIMFFFSPILQCHYKRHSHKNADSPLIQLGI